MTRLIKDAVVEAAEKVGEDLHGKNGLVGYLRRLAIHYPETFAGLIGRCIPLQVTGPGDGPIEVTEMSVEEAREQLRQRGIDLGNVTLLAPRRPPVIDNGG
jgi:hypothetical protein